MIKIRVAIISDIHGNIVALNEIIKDAKNKNVQKFIVSGDLVNELPFGNEVIERLKEIDALAIYGNKERYFIEYEDKKYNWPNIQFKNSVFMYNQMKKENMEYIKNLPFSLNLEYEGVKIKVVHGSPESVTELIYRRCEDLIDKYTKNLDADILILGHTHEPIWICEKNKKTVVNAGCAGVSPVNVGFAEYVIIDFENGKFDIKPQKANYDITKLKDGIIKSGLLEVDKAFINLTYLTLKGYSSIKHEFFTEAREKMNQRGENLQREDAQGIYKTFKLYDDDIWLELTKKYEDKFELKLEEK